MTLTANLGYAILPHPPYSPDLAWSNFFLFPWLKKQLRGKRFQDDDDVISAVEYFLNSQNETFYEQGIQQLMHRWRKCVALQGAYVEKD
jgi:histone-lysine N-methyltransferase SETMAR